MVSLSSISQKILSLLFFSSLFAADTNEVTAEP